MPVWWSPSSKTALAEAELEYNQSHQSRALYVRFRILPESLPQSLQIHCQHSRGVYGLVWTTTGWSMVRSHVDPETFSRLITQVGNRAVCYNENLEYSLVKSNGEHYIVATDLLSHAGKLNILSLPCVSFEIFRCPKLFY